MVPTTCYLVPFGTQNLSLEKPAATTLVSCRIIGRSRGTLGHKKGVIRVRACILIDLGFISCPIGIFVWLPGSNISRCCDKVASRLCFQYLLCLYLDIWAFKNIWSEKCCETHTRLSQKFELSLCQGPSCVLQGRFGKQMTILAAQETGSKHIVLFKITRGGVLNVSTE